MAPLDAMAEIDSVDAGRLYLQYGSADDVVPEDVSAQLIDAADGAKSDLYPAPHALNDDATADRGGWLVERLGLSPIGADVLAEVGLPDQPSGSSRRAVSAARPELPPEPESSPGSGCRPPPPGPELSPPATARPESRRCRRES